MFWDKKREFPKYELRVIGMTNEYTEETGNIQKSFEKLAEKLKEDIYLGGVELRLKEGNCEAEIRLSPRKVFLFKNNQESREFTESYLMDQLTQLKNMVTA